MTGGEGTEKVCPFVPPCQMFGAGKPGKFQEEIRSPLGQKGKRVCELAEIRQIPVRAADGLQCTALFLVAGFDPEEFAGHRNGDPFACLP